MKGTNRSRAIRALRGAIGRWRQNIEHTDTKPAVDGRALLRAGQWAAAAEHYELALARKGERAIWWAQLGYARIHLQQWKDAAEAYERAVALRDRRAEWWAQLGRSRMRTQEWDKAAAAYDAAAQRGGHNPLWLERAALARTRALQASPTPDRAALAAARAELKRARDAQHAAQKELLSRDPNADELDRRLVDASPESLDTRRTIAHMVADNIDRIRAGAEADSAHAPATPAPIFVFWAQGIANAPPIVRLCHERLLALEPDSVVALDAAAAAERVDIPPDVARAMGSDWTVFSELLRLELLARHGGVWMDATCLLTVPLRDALPELMAPTGFFAFHRRPARFASWFLASEPNHYMVKLLREAVYEYWRHFDHRIDYFYLFHTFEGLYHVDERFRALWDATPERDIGPPHALQRTMLSSYDPARFAGNLAGSFVHKLTYKYDPSAVRKDSMLAHLLRVGPTG